MIRRWSWRWVTPCSASGMLAVLSMVCSVTWAAGEGELGGRTVAGDPMVVPSTWTAVEGPSNDLFPMFTNGAQWVPYRYQQVYDGAEVGAGDIFEIAFRQDSTHSDTRSPVVFADVTVVISTTSAPPDGLSTAMDSNLGSDARVLFDGDLVMATTASTAEPRPFDLVIPVCPPFPFDPSAGNLLLEVTAAAEPPFWSLHDATNNNTPDNTSRVMCWGAAGCLTGDPANLVDSVGAITQFRFGLFADGFEWGTTARWSAATP